MIPGAPSDTTSSGSPSPRARRSWKNRAPSRRPPWSRPSTQAGPCVRPRRCPRRPAPPRAADPAEAAAGDAVDEQIDDGVLGKIALAEVLIFGPQTLGDLAHRRPRQKPSARLVGESILDVARRQAPRVKFDEPLEFPRAAQKRRPHARDERFGRVANLAPNIPPRPPRSSPCPSDSRCGSRPFRPRRAHNARGQGHRRPRPRAPRSTIRRSARRTRSLRPAAVPKSPFIKARSSSRVRSGADSLSSGAPWGLRRQLKAAFLLRFRQGASQPLFQQS